MTTLSTRPLLSAAAFAGLLLLAPIQEARAEDKGRAAPRAPTTGTNKQTTIPTRAVRDHRKKIVRDHRGVEGRTYPRQRGEICAGWFC